jgi:uncharacterized membrane protein YhaH (DUF805 family)
MERLRPYFSFEGRSTRLTYWRVQLVGGLLVLVPVVSGMLLATVIGQIAGLVMILVLPIMVAFVAVGVRRLHDRAKSGWWLFPFWVAPGLLSGWAELQGETADPLVLFASLASLSLSIWALVEMGFLRGSSGPNRYGYDPLRPEPAEVFS